jgi:poly(A) polymerase
VSGSVAGRLAAAPAVVAAAEALGDADGSAWLVGGAIRDALLDRDVVDVDLAVSGDAREAAKAIARASGGHAFELSAEFGTWRALAGSGEWHVDVSRVRGHGIEDDLAARDFTVNAIALPLGELDGEPIDPTGGRADIEGRVLRAASEGSFADDPLRVLRAARLAAGLALELEAGTAEAAREAAPSIGGVAGERQFAEIRLLMAGPDPLRGLALMDDVGVTAPVLPEVEALRGIEQNPNHHLDVHGHTIEVLARLLDVEGDLERYAGKRAGDVQAMLAEPLADELTRGEALRLGALVHDVGKPATRDEAGGYVTFIGHDSEGVGIVTGMCERLKTSRALSDHLRALTLHHLRLGFLATQRPLAPRTIYEYLRATEPVAVDVTLLSVADRLAARGEGPIASPEMVEAHLATAQDMIDAALDWRREGPPARLIRGDELARELGIKEGPKLGRLLGEIEAAQYSGEVNSRDEAIGLARHRLEGGG